MFERYTANGFHLGDDDHPDLLVTHYTPTGFGSLVGCKPHWKVMVMNSFKYSGPAVATVQWGSVVRITERATGKVMEITYSWRHNLLSVKHVAANDNDSRVIQLDASRDKVTPLG